MPGSVQTQTSPLKSLKRMQREHQRLLARVEKTAARLERRKAKIVSLEAAIADFERRMAEPRIDGSSTWSANGSLKQAQLIFNPACGRDPGHNPARLEQIVSSLRAHGIEAHVTIKTSGKVARAGARKALDSEHPLVIVASGDGTIGDVASQLVHTRAVLGIIPIGTMNNLARSLGVPLGIDDACALIAMGTTRHIDIGRVISGEKKHAQYFLECAGVGLGAIAAMTAQDFMKRRWHLVPRGLRKFFEAKLSNVIVEMDDIVVEAATRIVTVSNSPLIANNMLAAPEAKMDDGYFDVQIYEGMGDAELVKHFAAVSMQSPDGLKTYRARHVRITSEEPVLVSSDMDIAPERHVIDIELVTKALSMIVGNGIALSLPVEAAPYAPPFAAPPPHTNGVPHFPSAELLRVEA